MIINNNVRAVSGAYQLASSNAARKSYAREIETPKDEAIFSDMGQSFSNMLEKLKGIDDVRTEKVESLRLSIENGTCNPSANDIAGKMLAMLG